MCGICGGKSNKKLNIVQMTSSLRHRGPDFSRYYKHRKCLFRTY